MSKGYRVVCPTGALPIEDQRVNLGSGVEAISYRFIDAVFPCVVTEEGTGPDGRNVFDSAKTAAAVAELLPLETGKVHGTTGPIAVVEPISLTNVVWMPEDEGEV